MDVDDPDGNDRDGEEEADGDQDDENEVDGDEDDNEGAESAVPDRFLATLDELLAAEEAVQAALAVPAAPPPLNVDRDGTRREPTRPAAIRHACVLTAACCEGRPERMRATIIPQRCSWMQHRRALPRHRQHQRTFQIWVRTRAALCCCWRPSAPGAATALGAGQ